MGIPGRVQAFPVLCPVCRQPYPPKYLKEKHPVHCPGEPAKRFAAPEDSKSIVEQLQEAMLEEGV